MYLMRFCSLCIGADKMQAHSRHSMPRVFWWLMVTIPSCSIQRKDLPMQLVVQRDCRSACVHIVEALFA